MKHTHQGPHGEIPSNVTIDGSQVSYGRLRCRVEICLQGRNKA